MLVQCKPCHLGSNRQFFVCLYAKGRFFDFWISRHIISVRWIDLETFGTLHVRWMGKEENMLIMHME